MYYSSHSFFSCMERIFNLLLLFSFLSPSIMSHQLFCKPLSFLLFPIFSFVFEVCSQTSLLYVGRSFQRLAHPFFRVFQRCIFSTNKLLLRMISIVFEVQLRSVVSLNRLSGIRQHICLWVHRNSFSVFGFNISLKCSDISN